MNTCSNLLGKLRDTRVAFILRDQRERNDTSWRLESLSSPAGILTSTERNRFAQCVRISAESACFENRPSNKSSFLEIVCKKLYYEYFKKRDK